MFEELKYNKNFFLNNRKKLFKVMKDNSVAFILSSLNKVKNRDTFYKFRQDSNYFYFTGLELKRSVLALYKIDGRCFSTVFIKKLDPKFEKWIGKDIPEDEIKKISAIDDIRNLSDLDDFYNHIFNSADISKVYMYNELTPELVVPTYSQTFASNLRRKFNFIKISSLNKQIDKLRQIKNANEIKMIQRAVDITEQGFKNILSELKPGITENECEAILDYNYIKYGSRQPAFLTISASGVNGTVLHYDQNNRKTRKGDLILLDTGAEYKNYASDVTRTYPVSGKFTKEQKTIYKIVLKALKQVTGEVKPGITLWELQEKTKDILYKGLKKIKIIKKKEELSKYYYHGVSHFLGLDTHDVGIGKEPLKKNSVITVEPGLYIPEKNIGIRLENDILVTDKGSRNLSEKIPVEIEEIEEIMNRGK